MRARRIAPKTAAGWIVGGVILAMPWLIANPASEAAGWLASRDWPRANVTVVEATAKPVRQRFDIEVVYRASLRGATVHGTVVLAGVPEWRMPRRGGLLRLRVNPANPAQAYYDHPRELAITLGIALVFTAIGALVLWKAATNRVDDLLLIGSRAARR